MTAAIRRVRLDRLWSNEDMDELVAYQNALARQNFWVFRQTQHPTMIKGWFQRNAAKEFQKFKADMIAGKRPVLLLETPPQHGKSRQVADFLAWLIGDNPQLKVIYGSFSDRLGVRANLWLQRMIDNWRYTNIFGQRIKEEGKIATGSSAMRNREMLEWMLDDGTPGGYFRNTTVMGAVTGEGSDLGVIDDPIKGRAEANSSAMREKTWDWMTDDFMSRFSDQAALLMIMTRWHLDDPAGRMLKAFPNVREMKFRAIAISDEYDEDSGQLLRRKGEALFPEFKSLDFLMRQKAPMTQSGWESLYQQNPIIVGGGIFPVEKFGIPIKERPLPGKIKKSVRYWDKAGTADDGAYTAGVLIDWLKEGGFVISDVKRGQWSYLDRETIIKQTAVVDHQEGYRTEIWVEQEPGSGGKESAERTVSNLAGFSVYRDKVKGNKELRAEPYAAQVQAGNVLLVEAKWNRDFIDEHESFPNGKYKDQVDAAGGAFAKTTAQRIAVPTIPSLPVYQSADA